MGFDFLTIFKLSEPPEYENEAVELKTLSELYNVPLEQLDNLENWYYYAKHRESQRKPFITWLALLECFINEKKKSTKFLMVESSIVSKKPELTIE